MRMTVYMCDNMTLCFRVDLTVLELAKYEDGVCIRDTLTFLGSTEGIATPVCGNMTGYASK